MVVTKVIALAVVAVHVAFAVFIGAERNFLSVGISQLRVVRSLQRSAKKGIGRRNSTYIDSCNQLSAVRRSPARTDFWIRSECVTRLLKGRKR